MRDRFLMILTFEIFNGDFRIFLAEIKNQSSDIAVNRRNITHLILKDTSPWKDVLSKISVTNIGDGFCKNAGATLFRFATLYFSIPSDEMLAENMNW
jgi:hypothetical protein